MITLTGDWTTIKTVEGDDISVADDGYRIRVSFHESVSEAAVRKALLDEGIEVGDVGFEAGEADGETVAFFSKG